MESAKVPVKLVKVTRVLGRTGMTLCLTTSRLTCSRAPSIRRKFDKFAQGLPG